MKLRNNILLISLLVLSGLMVVATQPATAQVDGNTVVIGVIDGQNAYNVTEIQLEPNTEYTIIFENIDTLTNHNLRIDVDNDIESEGDVGDSDDILIGDENDNGGGVGIYEGTWTTPESGEFVFYCGFSGHYAAGMEGVFIVGDGAGAPGFGLFAGLAALFVIGFAVPQLRRD